MICGLSLGIGVVVGVIGTLLLSTFLQSRMP